jgi:NADPH:quinone reductase-like Zn-dependent oxidoreductase
MMSTASLPKTIRAVFQPDILSTDLVLTTMPIQLAREGTEEHLVKVMATAPCAGELLWAKNFSSMMDADRVAVPCNDLSGIVITAPPNSPFPAGTHVYTRTVAFRTGNARDYTIALTSELAVKPKSVSWEEAASVPVSAVTAYQALFEHGGLKEPWREQDPEAARAENSTKRVIITAAAGGVGVWVVQLARVAGVHDIVAVVGPDNIKFVKSLGASEVVNYREQSLGTWAAAAGRHKADLIVDMLGGQTLADCWTAVRDGGILLSIREPPEVQKPQENVPRDVTNYFFVVDPKGSQLKEIANMLDAGEVKPIVDSVWPLEQFKAAFAKLEGGHARGKVIIKVNDP